MALARAAEPLQRQVTDVPKFRTTTDLGVGDRRWCKASSLEPLQKLKSKKGAQHRKRRKLEVPHLGLASNGQTNNGNR